MDTLLRRIACCALGCLLASAAVGPPRAADGFEQRVSAGCKPFAPLELELGAPRARVDGALELEYSVRATAPGELLEPRLELGAGWTLVEHAADTATGPVSRGGRIVLRGDGRAAALTIVARLALPEPEASGGVIVHEREFAFGAPAPKALGGVRTVRTSAQVSRDVPALVP